MPPSATPPASGLEQGSTAAPAAQPDTSLPDAVHRAVIENLDGIRALADRLRGARRVRVAGVGSSWHLAEAGAHLLRSGGMDARAANAFDLATWPSHLEPDEALLLLCHPGQNQNAYTARLASRCTHSGLPFLAISHGSIPQMQPAAVHIDLSQNADAEQEPFAASFAVLLTIAARCAPESPLARAATTLRDQVRHAQQATTQQALTEISRQAAAGVTLVGAGPALAVAQAAAIQINASTGWHASALHLDSAITIVSGRPTALAGQGMVIHLTPAGAASARHTEFASLLRQRGHAAVWTIGATSALPQRAPSPDQAATQAWTTRLAEVPEAASPLQLSCVLSAWLHHAAAPAHDIVPAG